jgi:pilus assembly protein FimV
MHVPNRTSIVSFALKTLTGAVASAVLVAATANAAGLGKLTVLSALGQPLRAEIELTAVSADEASGLVAKLAPPEAFRTANIEFNPALLSLRFAVEQRNGRQFIRVSSVPAAQRAFRRHAAGTELDRRPPGARIHLPARSGRPARDAGGRRWRRRSTLVGRVPAPAPAGNPGPAAVPPRQCASRRARRPRPPPRPRRPGSRGRRIHASSRATTWAASPPSSSRSTSRST